MDGGHKVRKSQMKFIDFFSYFCIIYILAFQMILLPIYHTEVEQVVVRNVRQYIISL